MRQPIRWLWIAGLMVLAMAACVSPAAPTPTVPPTTTPAPTSMPSPTPFQVTSPVTFTVVFDNYAHDPALETEWGFSCLIETGQTTVLFDTGANGEMLLRNMAALAKDPARIDIVVLSHAHDDHTNGLAALLGTGLRSRLYLPTSFSSSFKAWLPAQVEPVTVKAPVEIVPGIWTTGSVTGNTIEQALVVQTTEGWVVVTGCAHPGVVRMVEHAKEATGGEIALVMGGFHLGNASQSQVARIITQLRDLGVKKVAPSHCTGDQQREWFRAAFGEDYYPGGVGWMLVMGP
ncbi:MAG: MBL fold metallo-hydrolase [Chloroflexi bacterium]|nr:MBL fold metallo-hydrolase [Chloroflexota bacterium]MBU1746393.1 MBL fold metallo-hydrolase [Chloroflexota bacterium]